MAVTIAKSPRQVFFFVFCEEVHVPFLSFFIHESTKVGKLAWKMKNLSLNNLNILLPPMRNDYLCACYESGVTDTGIRATTPAAPIGVPDGEGGFPQTDRGDGGDAESQTW
jgi:hypothetical protein